jgi:hypothetical protein
VFEFEPDHAAVRRRLGDEKRGERESLKWQTPTVQGVTSARCRSGSDTGRPEAAASSPVPHARVQTDKYAKALRAATSPETSRNLTGVHDDAS